MHLDDLLHAHQLAAMNVAAMGDDDLYKKVAEYAARIRQLRTGPKKVANTFPPKPQMVIYGSYAGDPATEISSNEVRANRQIGPGDESENPDRGRADP